MKLTRAELLENVRIRLETEYGGFAYDPELGSELWRLKRAKNVATIRADADRYIRDALKPEITAGNMDAVESVELLGVTATTFELGVTIRAGGDKFKVVFDGLAGRVIAADVVGC